MLQGPLGFLVFWAIALAFGVFLVVLVLGGSFGWLFAVALPAFVLLFFASRRGRR